VTHLNRVAATAVFTLLMAPIAASAQSMPVPMSSATSMSMPMPGNSAAPVPSPTARPARTSPTMPLSGSPAPAMSPPPIVPVPVVPNPLRPGWHSPVDDNPRFSYFLFDQLEYRATNAGTTGTRFDGFGWTGGDITRLWFKTEGFAPSGTARDREAEVSLLYGKLIKPFFDFQTGIRFVPGLGTKPSRTYAVVGYQGLAPYNFDIEPSLFISQSGRISARFTGSYDIPFTQRLFLQPRLETNVALQSDPEAAVGSGVNDIDLGLRLRYEIRREFAPYVGINWLQKFGQTHAFALREGPDRAQFPVLVGVRAWF